MTSIEIWAIGIVAAVITGILGFLLGRRQPVGSPGTDETTDPGA